MSEIKRYDMCGFGGGLVERPEGAWYHMDDFDRVTAERDAALAENKLLHHDVASYLETVAKICDMLGVDLEYAKTAEGKPSDVLFGYVRSMQQRLTAADERADVLEAENKRLDLMVSQSDYNYDADRMQFKARIDVLEGLLMSWLKDFGRTHSGLQRLKERTQAALKPAGPAKDEHVCTGCGSRGWTANCKECVPY